jgi:hypothetical protein
MILSDWRDADIGITALTLDKEYVYYIHSRAWGLKGYLGGTHPWLAFWCHEQYKWMVLETSDRETVVIQSAKTYFAGTSHFTDKTPILSDRDPRQKWFNATPQIFAKEKRQISVPQAIRAIEDYPFQNYKLLHRNCNTFFSFLVYSLNLSFKKPLVAIGFRELSFWRKLEQRDLIELSLQNQALR